MKPKEKVLQDLKQILDENSVPKDRRKLSTNNLIWLHKNKPDLVDIVLNKLKLLFTIKTKQSWQSDEE